MPIATAWRLLSVLAAAASSALDPTVAAEPDIRSALPLPPLPIADDVRDAIDAYDLQLAARGVTARHRRDVADVLGRFVAATGVRSTRALTLDQATRWLVQESERARRPPPGRPPESPARPVGSRTLNRQRAHLRAWGRWMMSTGRLPTNPFQGLPARPQRDRRRRRRSLTVEELRALLAAAPLARRACYLVAATTGLRRSELYSLRVEDARLDGDAPVVRLNGEAAKNGEEAVIPLAPAAAAILRELRRDVRGALEQARALSQTAGRLGRLLPVVPLTATFYRDLARAGIERVTDEGIVDLHSLRVTFATLLGRRGVGLSLVQSLMRHSDPRLTSEIYTRFVDGDRRGAVDALGGAVVE